MKYIALIIAMLLLSVGVFAENTSNKHEIAGRGLVYNIDKAIIGATEVITQIDDSQELELIIADLESLRDSIDLAGFDREQFEAIKNEAKELVTSFRTLADEALTTEQKQELRETIQEKQKAALEERREEYKSLKEDFNNRKLEQMSERMSKQYGEGFNASDLRERIEAGNFSQEKARDLIESLKERAQKWQNMSDTQRQEYSEDMKMRAENAREKMMSDSMRDAEKVERGEMSQREFLNNQKEIRREGMKDVMGDDELTNQMLDEVDRMQDEIVNEMDTNGDGEVSEAEAEAFQKEIMNNLPGMKR